jgi:hypothetical protein
VEDGACAVRGSVQGEQSTVNGVHEDRREFEGAGGAEGRIAALHHVA